MKRRKLLLGSLIALAFGLQQTSLTAQPRIRCHTVEHKDFLRQRNPKLDEQLRSSRLLVERWLQDHPDWRNESGGNLTIPVVVHVVYNNGTQNISDAQVQSQIDVLNEDFARLNADTVSTPAPFAAIAAPTPIRFCLAQRTPDDQPSNGIERRSTTVSSFNTNDDIKFFSSGGLDAWDPTRFFNIWVGPLGFGLLGYAEFPTSSPSNTYGIVIAYDAFGRIGTAAPPFGLGRTASHEVGHCFGLEHIWGDDGGSCGGSDNIGDTPNQADATSGCRTFPATDACTPSGNGVMFMNYMDYSDDDCLNIFTEDQAAFMVASLNTFYPSLITSDGCTPASIAAIDAGALAVVSPTGASCDTSITPVVTLRNFGADPLTSVNIYYAVDGGAFSSYAWTGNLASLTNTNVTLPPVSVSGGPHTFTSYTGDPNGGSDANNANDTATSSFSTNTLGAALPVTEGFESAFPPAGFTLDNPDGLTTWESSTSAHSGTVSAFVDNYDYNGTGQEDHLVLPAFDLTTISNPELSFWVAYAHYDGVAGLLTDSLEVSVSTDCGLTWTTLFNDGGQSLNTTAGGLAVNNSFTPASTEWERFSISLLPYASTTNAIVRFTNINGYGNNLYLDDINIDLSTAVGQRPDKGTLTVFPNPGKGVIQVRLPEIAGKLGMLTLRDITGRLLLQHEIALSGNDYRLDAGDLAPGTYSVALSTGEAILHTLLEIR